MINLFSNKEILNIITNNLLDKIYIIEKNDFVFICPYSKFYTYKKVKDSLRKKIINLTQIKMSLILKEYKLIYLRKELT